MPQNLGMYVLMLQLKDLDGVTSNAFLILLIP